MKINRIIISIVAILFFVLGYNQSQKIENKEDKVMQAYQMLEDAQKQRIKNKNNIWERSDIRKIKIKRNTDHLGIQRYSGMKEDYFGKTVYEVTFPIEEEGRPETEFTILYNLELTQMVGYRGVD